MHKKYRVAESLAGINLSRKSEKELNQIFLEILNAGIYGISFSAYLENQLPGCQITEEQIHARMKIIKPYVKWVRSFSCTEGNEHIPRIAHENGIKTLVGAWLGKENDKNDIELDAIIKVAKAGHADVIAIGNEVMLRGDLSEGEIIDAIQRVKREVPGIPVSYVDAYFEFAAHPGITDACDIIYANCYPFWEGFSIDHSLLYLKEMYHIAVKASRGKKVIISETGWPNIGTPEKEAVPSNMNALKYFINAFNWAAEENIDIFYFSSFDETWKIDVEGDVGAYWGLWDKDGSLKYGS